MKEFFADKNINLEDYIIETYFFETCIDPKNAAVSLCQEQSTAQWKRVGVDEDFRPKHGAKVLDLKVVDKESLAGHGIGREDKSKHWCEVKIAHPHINFGAKIPNLLTASAGEGAFYSHGITTIKLLDIEFPDSFINQFEGPKFGISGIRKILNAYERPIFFGVIKPNIGLAPKDFAEIAGEAWAGGLDIAKDDEMISDVSWSPTLERTKLCVANAKKAEDETGEKKIFLANITDEVENLIRLHDMVVENGAGMVMVNVMAVGLSAVRMLRRHATVPVIAHFDCIAPLSRSPFHGISSELITKFQRIVGCDAIIMPGFGERMKTTDKEVLSNVAECTNKLGKMLPALPVPGGSDHAGTLPTVYEKLGTYDFGFVPGRGVFGHPMGPRCGAASLRQAWEAISTGISLSEYAKAHKELAEALNYF